MSNEETLGETLAEAVAGCGLEITAEQLAQLDAYREMMWAWNEKLNLTRHTTIEKFVTRDLVDTIELSKLLEPGEKVLDIGSGGGVPGIPLAILRPDLDLRLCESVAKKANVLADMIERLELPVTLYASRVEAVVDKNANTPQFDTLIARAVAPLWKFMFWLGPHNQGPKSKGAPNNAGNQYQGWSRLLLIKGPNWTNERGEARHRGVMKGFDLRRIGEYTTPRTDAVTTVLSVTRHTPEPPKKGPKSGRER